MLVTVLCLNRGHFTYSLDDAYIHLSLAENISQGHYGVNAQEFSAPSSSIVWPFLLALGGISGVPLEWLPLMLNVVCSILIVSIWGLILDRLFNSLWLKLGLCGFMIVGVNMFGLLFSGMEHSLQVLSVIVVCLGILTLLQDDRLAPLLILALVFAPLVRYENLAVTFSACTMVFLSGRRKAAVAIFALSLCIPLVFSLWLHMNGVDWMPSSVLAKSDVVNSSGSIAALMDNFAGNLMEKRGRGILHIYMRH